MENDIIIARGDFIEMNSERYRIIEINDDIAIAVSMSHMTVVRFDSTHLFRLISDGEVKQEHVEEDDGIAIEGLNTGEARKYADFFEKILSDEYPEWDKLFGKSGKRNILKPYAETADMCVRSFRLKFLIYLRSGRNWKRMIDGRHFRWVEKRSKSCAVALRDGPEQEVVTQEDLILEEALALFKKYAKDHNKSSVMAAFNDITRKYYMKPEYVDGRLRSVLMPQEQRLSYYKVYRYISNNLGGLTIKQYIAGSRDYRNNERMLPGNSRTGITTIGDLFQLDECEVAVTLVSERDPMQVIGKAILYVAIDAFSGMIVGANLGFANNSYSGFCDLMITMLEPHQKQTEKVGVECTETQFPSLVFPKEIRADHGSEYESKALMVSMNELGIRTSLVPVAAGSYKGLVENAFMRLQHVLRNTLIDAGYIVESHEGPDKARQQACLTIFDLREIVYRIIIDLNTLPMPGYSMTREMMEAGCDGSPMSIWEFEKKRCGDPTNVTEQTKQSYLYGLLSRGGTRKFKLTRAGIEYVGHSLRYFIDEDWFMEMIAEGECPEIRYYDQYVDAVYFVYKKRMRKIPLAAKREELATFKGMSWSDYDTLYKESRQKIDKNKILEQKLNTEAEILRVKEFAKDMKDEGRNRTKNVKVSRKTEDVILKSDQKETGRRLLSDGEPEQSSAPELPVVEEPKDTVDVPTREELLAMLMGDEE